MANWWEPVTNKEVYGEGCKNPESFLQLDEAEGQMAVKLPNELYDEDQKIKNAKNIERAKAYAEFHEGGDFGGLKTETKEYK